MPWDDPEFDHAYDSDRGNHTLQEALAELRDGYWMQKDGRLIHISAMADSHLKNSLRLILLKWQAEPNPTLQTLWSAWADTLRAELNRRVKV